MKNEIKIVKTLVSLRSAKEYEKNPFIINLKGNMFISPRANSIIQKGQGIIDMETGEITENQLIMGKRKLVDKSQFAKIYANSIGVLYEISKPAQNVFMYLTKVMDYDNRAYFNYIKEHKKLGYKSETAPLKGLRELITNDIIACDVRENQYWLNPTIVCKGERFSMYTEYVIDNKTDNSLVEHKKEKALESPNSLFDSNNENPYKQMTIEEEINKKEESNE